MRYRVWYTRHGHPNITLDTNDPSLAFTEAMRLWHERLDPCVEGYIGSDGEELVANEFYVMLDDDGNPRIVNADGEFVSWEPIA